MRQMLDVMATLLDADAVTSPIDRPPAARNRVRRFAPLALLLAGTAVAYVWMLSESGYANSFYSAAAQAGSQSWKAFFYGSLDAGNAITVDKPPASLWLMGLSVRLLGLSSWSILLPQALLGIGTVWLVYLTVRRTSGEAAALAAGALTALTPAAVLMFRFNNPDALLLFLMVAAGYAMTRAMERASGRWLALAGALVGLGFLTKMLQAFLVLPAFTLVYLLAAPTSLWRRVRQLLVAFVAMLVSAGWWVAIVELVPESSRPYIDGSHDNSILDLVWSYNGIARLTGASAGGLGNSGFSSAAGPLRLFGGVSDGMISWLLPAALLLLLAGVVFRGLARFGGSPRTDPQRAALLMSGGVLLTTGVVFSFMEGIYHDYYVVALAPWIAMTAATGFAVVWVHRSSPIARIVLTAALLGSTVWAFVLLGQAGSQPYSTLRWLVLPTGLLVAGALGLNGLLDGIHRRLSGAAVAAAVIVVGAGPASYAVQTIGTSHSGSIVTAGPESSSGARSFGGPSRQRFGLSTGQQLGPQGNRPGSGFPGRQTGGAQTSGQPGRGPASGQPGGGLTGGTRSSAGGNSLINGTVVGEQIAAVLAQDAEQYRWAAATLRSQSAASYQLASGHPVMAIGGFNGTVSSPTLEQFQEYVTNGQIHYFISTGTGALSSTSTSSGSEIQQWVTANFTARTVDGTTLYDLTSPTVESSEGQEGTGLTA